MACLLHYRKVQNLLLFLSGLCIKALLLLQYSAFADRSRFRNQKKYPNLHFLNCPVLFRQYLPHPHHMHKQPGLLMPPR